MHRYKILFFTILLSGIGIHAAERGRASAKIPLYYSAQERKVLVGKNAQINLESVAVMRRNDPNRQDLVSKSLWDGVVNILLKNGASVDLG